MKYDVFISCKSEDYPLAEEVYAYLTDKGFSVFLSSKELRQLGKTEYMDAISKALDDSYHLLVVASSAANIESRWVRFEWSTFLNEQLSGRKQGQIFTLLKDVSVSELPLKLRCFESLTIDNYKDRILPYVETPEYQEREEEKKLQEAKGASNLSPCKQESSNTHLNYDVEPVAIISEGKYGGCGTCEPPRPTKTPSSVGKSLVFNPISGEFEYRATPPERDIIPVIEMTCQPFYGSDPNSIPQHSKKTVNYLPKPPEDLSRDSVHQVDVCSAPTKGAIRGVIDGILEVCGTMFGSFLRLFTSSLSANSGLLVSDDSIRGKKQKTIESHSVYSSVFAPAEVAPNQRVMVQVYLHFYEETDKVKELANEADKYAERRGYEPLEVKLKNGDTIEIDLNVNGDTLCYSNRKKVVWQGSFVKRTFDFLVPPDLAVRELSCSVNIFVNGAIAGEMLFLTNIVDTPRKLNTNVDAKPTKKLFISYSHKDQLFAERIAKIHEALGIDVFFDKHRLKAGYIYSEEISQFIKEADTFVLCWSENAAKSDYVEKERQEALALAYPQCKPRERATLRIHPYNIEPHAAPPADMIEHYHFEEL